MSIARKSISLVVWFCTLAATLTWLSSAAYAQRDVEMIDVKAMLPDGSIVNNDQIPRLTDFTLIAFADPTLDPFVSDDKIRFEGAEKQTFFDPSKPYELRASILASDTFNEGSAGSGQYAVTVFDNAGQQIAQNQANMLNPQPVISEIEPKAKRVNSGVFSLIVTGDQFVSESQVHFNGQPKSTVSGSADGTQITASIPATDIQNVGIVKVKVVTPANDVDVERQSVEEKDFSIKQGFTLSVESTNPSSGVAVTVNQTDINGDGSGTTPFDREYNDGTNVQLEVPPSQGGNVFTRWLRDGVPHSTDRVTSIVMDADHTMTAEYGSCSYQLSTSEQNVGPGSTEGSFSVSAPEVCEWNAITRDDWIEVTNGMGEGNGRVEYTVAENTGTQSREGTIEVGNQTFTVKQQGTEGTCTYTIQAEEQSFGPGSETGSFSVNAPTGCAWNAMRNDGWITVTSGSGSGNGTVQYSVAENTSTQPREGTISVETQTFTVKQRGTETNCSYTLTENERNFSSVGGSGNFNVNAPTGCEWDATSNAGWLTVTPGSGSGNGPVQYTVDGNTSTQSREGTISVEDQTFRVNQQGVTVATPNVTIRTSDAFAAEERQRPGMLTVSRGASAVGDLAVMYSLAGTASDADYSLVPNAVHSVTIPDGSSEATIRVVPVDDTELEGNETVVVSLLDGSSYDLSIPNVASVNITDNEPGTPTHQISADRNPCELPSEGSCTTTITWNTSADNAFVTVQNIGEGAEASEFAFGTSGSQPAEWINRSEYIFTLYEGEGIDSQNKTRLASINVVGKLPGPPPPRGMITADPNPCTLSSPGGRCTTTIEWATSADVSDALVTVKEASFAPKNVSGQLSGSVTIPWIGSNPYLFTLYEIGSGGQRSILDTVAVTGTVEGAPPPPSVRGTITADPNPCTLSSPGGRCTTTIEWATSADVSDALVTVKEASFAPKNVSGQLSGSVTIPWIGSNPYLFTLYEIGSGGQKIFLDSVPVTGTLAATAPSGAPFAASGRAVSEQITMIEAIPNPCQITSGQSCASTIVWRTDDFSNAEIWMQNIGVGEDPALFAVGTGGSRDSVIKGDPNLYQFTLYGINGGDRVELASVTVSDDLYPICPEYRPPESDGRMGAMVYENLSDYTADVRLYRPEASGTIFRSFEIEPHTARMLGDEPVGNDWGIQVDGSCVRFVQVASEWSEDDSGSFWFVTNDINRSFRDDHGDAYDSATPVALNTTTRGEIEERNGSDDQRDIDFFRIVLTEPGRVSIYTIGDADTFGALYDSSGSFIYSDDNGSDGRNFYLDTVLGSGTYYVSVRCSQPGGTGDYSFRTDFK